VNEKLGVPNGQPDFMKGQFRDQAERAMLYAAMAQFQGREKGPNSAKRRGRPFTSSLFVVCIFTYALTRFHVARSSNYI